MSYDNTEEASDARFNVPHVEPEQQNPFRVPGYAPPIDAGADGHTGMFTRPERGKAQGYVLPESMTHAPVWPSVSGPGLHFVSADGVPFSDMARTLTEPDQLANVHEVDLRTILAHLDSSARAIKAELDLRYTNGNSR